jgi:flagellar biosynthetic protein FliP
MNILTRLRPWLPAVGLVAVFLGVFALVAAPASAAVPVPTVSIGLGGAKGPNDTAATLQVIALLTVLSLAPAILMLTTAFTRIVIVLSFVRQAIGTQMMPPNQVIIGLSLFLTFFVMAPVAADIQHNAWDPFMNKQISQEVAMTRAEAPIRQFMFKQTREKDLALFVKMAKIQRPRTAKDVPTYVVVPAFITSELKTAFQIGFVIYLPFLIIDMVVASILMSMGMMMLPPVVISLPFKIILFVLVDGWHLLSRALVTSFN